ncbi:tetratricopeptide repeat protein [Nocardiopsis ansamitocini]|uniref:Tetratricopeptide repeat protein n=1 Tax=Nocardiopsis ansamitocini TaxID=1670832 RepID=A0A9W6UHL0_9ACTN|nr:tetratricopeptide repeat protein [Nocardiopsis ansamitocini]GLU48976.1 hypothetical protein Nans01_33270 [Nocardiopsis ansamitocini]
MKLALLLTRSGQIAIGLALGWVLWESGRPFLGVALALAVAVIIPGVTWWLFERRPPPPSGAALAKEISRDELLLGHHEELLGQAHPETLTSRNNLAFDYVLAGRLSEAIRHYEVALTFAIHVQGPHHPETLTVRRNLADAYRRADRPLAAACLDTGPRTDLRGGPEREGPPQESDVARSCEVARSR